MNVNSKNIGIPYPANILAWEYNIPKEYYKPENLTPELENEIITRIKYLFKSKLSNSKSILDRDLFNIFELYFRDKMTWEDISKTYHVYRDTIRTSVARGFRYMRLYERTTFNHAGYRIHYLVLSQLFPEFYYSDEWYGI